MSKLYLYTVFHFNLAFSSIPKEQYSSVIDTCYWPIVELLDKYPEIRLGFEFTGDTLEKINQSDYTLIQKIRDYEQAGRCEIIAAGISQAIFPLIPGKANEKNLEQGNKIYEKYFSKVPETIYVNEQTFSNGLINMFERTGYKNIIMEYENSSLYNNYDSNSRYFSHKLGNLNIVWNSSINFQKLQRYNSGIIELDEYIESIMSNWCKTEDRSLLLYGSDVEIFDYKPGNSDGIYKGYSGKEIERLYKLFDEISKRDELELVTPSFVAEKLNSYKQILLGTPEYPVVCKKQPKYNVVRWAVSGREDTKINTECIKLFNSIQILKNLGCNIEDEKFYDLSLLWGSDYRTKTTESKVSEFYYILGKLQQQLLEKERELLGKYEIKHDFIIINPNETGWNQNCSFEFEVNFENKFLFENQFKIEINNMIVQYQLDEVERFRDGSIRRCKMLLMLPVIRSGQVLHGKFLKSDTSYFKNEIIRDYRVQTENVDVEFSKVKRGTIEKLSFPGISKVHAIGLIPHGYFEDIRYSLDMFSGHTIIRDRSLKQITDLDNSDLIIDDDPYNLRISVKSKIKGSFGELWKIYRVYRYEPKIDIEYNFRLNDLNPIFFRTGILTFNPEYFNEDKLAYNTINGGTQEEYSLSGKNFDQSEQVSMDISANGCLGATNGWVDFHDDEKGILVYHDKSILYGVPMLTYREIKNKKMLRIQHSISETDDTGSIFWRGHSRFKMSICGYANENRKAAVSNMENYNLGLILIQR